MESGQDMLLQISDTVTEKRLRYNDSVIIGDNSTGKSGLLKNIVNRLKDKEPVYFIDSVNRFFDVKKISFIQKLPEYKTTILTTRIDQEHFNLVDSFDFYGTKTERIEMVYQLLEEQVQVLFKELTGKGFTLIEGDVFGEVEFDEGKSLLSSGYQAIVRILLELLYFRSTALNETPAESVWVIIDEIDEFLSPRFSGMIWSFLKRNFPEYCFIVTTHSSDLVVNCQDANLIILENNTFGVWDINDYSSTSSVQIIFDRVFGKKENIVDENIYICLRNLLSKKINGVWSEVEEEQLKSIPEDSMTASQKVIYKQIIEW